MTMGFCFDILGKNRKIQRREHETLKVNTKMLKGHKWRRFAAGLNRLTLSGHLGKTKH